MESNNKVNWFRCSTITFIIAFVSFGGITLIWGIHTVHDRHVSVYFRYGALVQYVGHPGLNIRIPIITEVFEIDVSEQSDFIYNVPCVSFDSIKIKIGSIEVINQLHVNHVINIVSKYGVNYDQPLIFYKLKFFTEQICNNMTSDTILKHAITEVQTQLIHRLKDSLKHISGLDIIGIRLSDIEGPQDLMNKYQELELVNKNLELAEKQATALIKNITKTNEAHMLKLDAQIKITEKEKQISEINNAKQIEKVKAESEANNMLLTSRYLEMLKIRALNNSKLFIFDPQVKNLLNLHINTED